MLRTALPVLGVSSSEASEAFYCGKLGFRREYIHRPNEGRDDPARIGVVRGGAHLVLSSFEGDGPPGSQGTQLLVDDAAALQRELREAGVGCGEELV